MLILAALGLGPALALLLAPVPAVFLPIAVALSGACSLAVILNLHRRLVPARPGQSLTRNFAETGRSYPAPGVMRSHLAARLAPGRPAPHGWPPDRAAALRSALQSVLAQWKGHSVEALADWQLRELFLLDHVLTSDPVEAGRSAQIFRQPDRILALRDAVIAQGTLRAAFERQMAAFDATVALRARSAPPQGLLEALRALGAADIDLWHHIVREHDRNDPAARAAALWCVEQTGCDRATVALYLDQIARDGRLEAAARRHDEVLLARLRGVVSAVCRGDYRCQELGLEPPERLADAGPVFSRALGALAELTGERRWPDPAGLFVPYPGRPPRPRPHWDLTGGGLVRAPDLADFADLGLSSKT